MVLLFVASEVSAEAKAIRILETERSWHGSYKNFSFTQNAESADFILVPQYIRHINGSTLNYINELRAKHNGKKIIIFIVGDNSNQEHLDFDDLILFKGNAYRHSVRDNEVVFSAYIQEALNGELKIRSKGKRPVVGFCGYAGFPRLRTYLKYIVKNAALDALSVATGKPQFRAYKRGIYFRRKSMELLAQDSRIETNFIVRDSFSGNVTTASGDPAVLRREYIENMLQSDFILAPKGDGNYSARFYEVLSLGRIPVLIDTEMVLPLEQLIDYDSFIIRVPHTELHRIGDYIVKRYEQMSDAEYVSMQRGAREAFVRYLRHDSYFNTAFPILKEKGPGAL